MSDLIRRAREFGKNLVHIAKVFPGAYYHGHKEAEVFSDVETVCFFIGYPRSGHSLIGSLLDAHPNILMAHELGALRYVYSRFDKTTIFHLMRMNSLAFTRGGRTWSGYSYAVPTQWQGKNKRIKVIGDKHGETSTLWLGRVPSLIEVLPRTFSERVKFVHVIRNPYDNIATIAQKIDEIGFQEIRKKESDLVDAINHYFWLCETVAALRLRLDVLDVHHEALVLDPVGSLTRMCSFLGVDAPEDYLRDCARIVFRSPNRSRHRAPWSADLIEEVRRRMERVPFLDGYSYAE